MSSNLGKTMSDRNSSGNSIDNILGVFKVSFEWYQSKPQGGRGEWKDGFVLFDAKSANDLNCAIADHIESKSSCYCEHMKATDIVCILSNDDGGDA